MIRIIALLFLVFGASVAHADELPKLVQNGEHTCQISKEYKFRKCRVIEEGKVQILSLYEEGHLLQLEGIIHPTDFIGKKQQVFVEAWTNEDRPYICSTKDPQGLAECKAQRMIINLKKSGNTWKGSFPIKHYWDRYVGEGAERRPEGYVVTVEEISFTLKLDPAPKK